MKKIFLMLLGGLMAMNAAAIPANPQPVVTVQPDGSQVTLRLCGDEFYSFSTTEDGYTVVRNTAGYWVYAQRNGSDLVASQVIAHDAGMRTAAEQAFLAGTPRQLTSLTSVAGAKKARAQAQAPQRVRTFDISKFRGLVILVQPSDVAFKEGANAQSFYNEMINTKNFTGFTGSYSTNYGVWTGSVRDYYYDNTNGIFDPQFDVIGPVSVSQKSTTFHSNCGKAFREALDKVDLQVDFTKYDGDGDGKVDMVFFLVAGNGSNIEGNNSGLLWPHKSGLGGGKYDGKTVDVYACSTELGGSESYSYMDGIGVICHEFTHVLGFPDLYDANYETNGQTHDPGEWDIMAGGGYLNYGRTPSGYGIFERYALGFANPTVISSEGSYTLNSLGNSNEGFILKSPVKDEYFIMENRQATKWDCYLPGHGMLVTRVDSTNAYYWVTNQVNNYSEHMYYEMLRAGNTSSGALASDPFPGIYGVSNLTNTTMPNLKTWAGKSNTYDLMRINEKNGIITFDVVKAGQSKSATETFNKLGLTATTGIGDMTSWQLASCAMTTVEGGNLAVAMKNPSVLRMTQPVYYTADQVCFDVNNTSGDAAKITLQYTLDGKTWKDVTTSLGAKYFSVPGGSTFTTYWNVSFTNTQAVQFRVTMTAGSKTAPCLIDNFTIFYSGTPGGGGVRGDLNGDGKADVADVNIMIDMVLGKQAPVNAADLNNNGVVDVSDVNLLIDIVLGK